MKFAVGDLVTLKGWDIRMTVTAVFVCDQGLNVYVVYPDKTFKLHKEVFPAGVLEAVKE